MAKLCQEALKNGHSMRCCEAECMAWSTTQETCIFILREEVRIEDTIYRQKGLKSDMAGMKKMTDRMGLMFKLILKITMHDTTMPIRDLVEMKEALLSEDDIKLKKLLEKDGLVDDDTGEQEG